MPTDDEFADDFARALRGVAELAPEPVQHTLALAAEQRGRRWRRRRRTAVAGGLAALVLVGAGGFAAIGRGPLGGVGPAAPDLPAMSQDEMVALVGGLLPQGKVKVLYGDVAGSDRHRASLVLMFDDGAGESVIDISVERTKQRPDANAFCQDGFTTPQDSCDRSVRPDGSALVVERLRDTYNADIRKWEAVWAGPDGRRLQIAEYNGQPAVANRPNPPLAVDQLSALATSPAWDRVFASLAPVKGAPKPGDAPAPTPSQGPSNAELLAKLVPLLPAGAKVSGQDAQRAVLTVTVEGRSSMLMVGVEPPSQRGRDDFGTMDRDRTTPLEVREKRSDGALVVTNRFGNGKTATDQILHWTADVHYPDGGQVRISEWNGENGFTFKPGTPALDVDQLKAIVTNPAWRS
ncbi:hypothetical protein F7Q99_37690 [Streptomyces kaniharaensis]|uniref:Uncharacterized protein n=1 Tax=Streptomyces kaniharaensis TaxID=212423 RepID=A0A6N7L1Q4_9ACTN|nr:hypothetical protein [Streptomyces kaniharaensis]MQS17772.1 hypothetical protein [Streptomyces kaniharaensis]